MSAVCHYPFLGAIRPGALHVPNIADTPSTSPIPDLESYGPRVVGCLDSSARLVIDASLVPDVSELLAYLRERFNFADSGGLIGPRRIFAVELAPGETLTQGVLRDSNLVRRLAAECSQAFVEPFYATHEMPSLAAATQKHLDTEPGLASFLNDKETRQLFGRDKILVPEFEVVVGRPGELEGKVLQAFRRLNAAGWRGVFLKARTAYGGTANFFCPEREAVCRSLSAHFVHESYVIVEGGVPDVDHLPDGMVSSPSAQVRIGKTAGDDVVLPFGHQLLDKTAHFGNIIDPALHADALADSARLEVLERCMNRCRKMGYRGVVGFDFVSAKGKLWLVDVNARHTGGIFAPILAQRIVGADISQLCIGCAAVPVAPTTSLGELVDSLDRRGLHYSTTRGSGLIVVNASTAHMGKVHLGAIARSRAEVMALIAEASKTSTKDDSLIA